MTQATVPARISGDIKYFLEQRQWLSQAPVRVHSHIRKETENICLLLLSAPYGVFRTGPDWTLLTKEGKCG